MRKWPAQTATTTTKVNLDRFAQKGTHPPTLTELAAVDVEEGGELHDVLEEGEEVQEVLEESGEVPEFAYMGLFNKLFSVPVINVTTSSKRVGRPRRRGIAPPF